MMIVVATVALAVIAATAVLKFRIEQQNAKLVRVRARRTRR